ncbi:DUF2795 domain-containing protein, partial [Blastococcus sp. CCUG 61487]|uniref:DUF2795 domain-containing protein n=1 Tax=Blastococcus sp. CCUG 61487 TaxID=1840703 RepID=UPI001BAF317E
MTDPLTPEDVLRYLEDVDYPAGKEALVDAAERAGASEAVIRSLRAIPPVEYRRRAEVARSVHVDPGAGRSASRAAGQPAPVPPRGSRSTCAGPARCSALTGW